MKNKIRLITIGIFLNLSLLSQPLVFEKIFNYSSHDALIDFIPTEDQGFVMIGSSSNNSFVTKLDSNGDFLWKNIIGTSGDHFTQIIQAQNSDLIITGQQSGDAVLLRFSISGDSISSIHYPYAFDNNSFIGVIETENGNLIISEREEKDGGNYPPRVFLRKFNSLGTLNWSQEIGDEHYPNNIILTDNNNIILAGEYNWWDGPYIWFSKYDSLGNNLDGILMDKKSGNQIIEASDGYLYSAVDGYSPNENFKVVKLDSDFALEWKLNNNNESGCYFNTICQLEPNRFAIGGNIHNNLNITIFNENGDSISSFNYNKYFTQSAKRIFSNQTSLTVGGTIRDSANNSSILVLQILLDSLYTSNYPSHIQPQKTEINIFPNPAETIIDLSNFQVIGESIKVLIYSINGDLKLMKEFETGHHLVLNVESLIGGYYIAKIITKDKISYGKFVKI